MATAKYSKVVRQGDFGTAALRYHDVHIAVKQLNRDCGDLLKMFTV